MFNGFTPRVIDFMWGLRLNNEKPWFEAHKEDFRRDFQTPMKELGEAVFVRVNEGRESYGFIHKLSRIYKDARRVRGGAPYRENLWFSIEKPSEEWTGTPVFWFELSPEEWNYGLGYYQAKAETMAKFRARLEKNPGVFEKLIAPLEKQAEFSLDGAEYVRKKTPPTEKTAPWFNKKSFCLIHRQPNGEELYAPELAERVAAGMLSLMPLYDYFSLLEADPSPRT